MPSDWKHFPMRGVAIILHLSKIIITRHCLFNFRYELVESNNLDNYDTAYWIYLMLDYNELFPDLNKATRTTVIVYDCIEKFFSFFWCTISLVYANVLLNTFWLIIHHEIPEKKNVTRVRRHLKKATVFKYVSNFMFIVDLILEKVSIQIPSHFDGNYACKKDEMEGPMGICCPMYVLECILYNMHNVYIIYIAHYSNVDCNE